MTEFEKAIQKINIDDNDLSFEDICEFYKEEIIYLHKLCCISHLTMQSVCRVAAAAAPLVGWFGGEKKVIDYLNHIKDKWEID